MLLADINLGRAKLNESEEFSSIVTEIQDKLFLEFGGVVLLIKRSVMCFNVHHALLPLGLTFFKVISFFTTLSTVKRFGLVVLSVSVSDPSFCRNDNV